MQQHLLRQIQLQAVFLSVVAVGLPQHQQVGVARLQAQPAIFVHILAALLARHANARGNFFELAQRLGGALFGMAQVLGDQHAAAFVWTAGQHVARHAGDGGADQVGAFRAASWAASSMRATALGARSTWTTMVR